MSSWHDPATTGVKKKGDAADQAVDARFDTNLGRMGPSRPAHTADEIAAAKAAAKSAGYAAGWAEGKRTAKDQAELAQAAAETERREFLAARQTALERALGAVTQAATSFERRAAAGAADIEDQLVSAAFALAEAVLGRELALSDSPGRDAIARALALLPVGRPVVVRLNPHDHQILIGQRPDAAESGVLNIDGRTVTLQADPSLASGDAIAESDSTTVDARLSAALLRVSEALGMVDAEGQPW